MICGVMFYALKFTIGLRVSSQEELEGLDIGEHGASAYPDLLPTPETGAPVPMGSGVPVQAS